MVAVAGRDLTVTSPDKVFFSERGETKLDLVRYYLAVAEPLMRAAGGRPTLMQRFPHGAEGSSFFQKRVPGDGARVAADDDRQHAERDDLARARPRRHGPRRLGREPGLPRLPRLAVPPRPPRRRGRAAARPRSAARRRLRRRAGRGGRASPSARRARDRRLPEDDRQPGPPRLRPARAALGLLPGAGRGGRRRARARAPASRADHRGVVEGGARPPRLRRLQPERAAQDRLRRVVGARAPRRPGLDAADLGRGRRHSTPTS